MLINKKNDMTPFDMLQTPQQTPFFLLPLMWGGSRLMTALSKSRLRIKKTGLKGIRPPYLVISMHQGFSDYYIAPLALFPRRAFYVSDMEGFAGFGKALYRALGCIGKRRFVSDYTVIKNISHAFSKKKSVVIFPESRHSNIGTTSLIPGNMGKLAKYYAAKFNTPLVMLLIHGSYLKNPFWDEEHTRKGKLEAELRLVYTAEELLEADEDIVQKKIEELLSYDEYAWQEENRLSYTGKNLAEGMHLPLYRCFSCGTKYRMTSSGNKLTCSSCGQEFTLTPKGKLFDKDSHAISPVEWYNSEKEEAIRDLHKQGVNRKFNVRIESLPNEYGFVKMGTGTLLLDDKAFELNFHPSEKYNYTPKDWHFNQDGSVTVSFPHKIRESVQTEYNYRGHGPAIVLSHRDATYYLYSDDKDFNPTEIQFIAEELYAKTRILNQSP
ncbi:MAG: 1-acyl-sn-glycerol-3-phosphate acyltransferase [Treponema sp.]|nr:1-acyl-sn-glycerol-3-phosphate acyltransferase [Treponema sp.]